MRTTTRTRTRRKRTTGIRRLLLIFLLLAAVSSVGGWSAPEPAVIAGTVFRDPGFALPGAEVTLSVTTPPAGVKAPKKKKLFSDVRGEFAFYVPPVRAEYVVEATAPGYEPERKPAVVQGGAERLDLYFTLKPKPR